MRRVIKGFTLLEILIVVIIVGILAALAIPYYVKTAESSKAAEAYNNLSAIRQAELVHYGRTGYFIISEGTLTDFSDLDIEDPNTMPNRNFDYYAMGGDIYDLAIIKAWRKSGPYQGDYIWMDLNGNIYEDYWLQ